jgi:nucleoside-diphosphate-sugar epimerase
MLCIKTKNEIDMRKILITGGSGFIGTNIVAYYRETGISVINVDKAEPKNSAHIQYWEKCDILDADDVTKIFVKHRPEIVIHLAAETRVGGKDLDYYRANTIGVSNVLYAISQCKSVKRTIVASTQYVFQSNRHPISDEEYLPLGVYGESKVITERLLRENDLSLSWTIIRPTNIWGPWHNVYPEGLWRQILKGRYLHPGKTPVNRSYGYIGNVVAQIVRIMEAQNDEVDGKVYYVGDEPVNLYDWVNAFSLRLTGKNVIVVPRIIIAMLALFGDALQIIGVPFPLTSSRYRNMVVDNPAPMAKSIAFFGKPKYSLTEGVEISVRWYLNDYLNRK